jgi:hypothetical protein
MAKFVNHSSKSEMSSHTPGTFRGEEATTKKGIEPGRETGTRTARDSTAVNAKARDPIDPRMPYMPPA